MRFSRPRTLLAILAVAAAASLAAADSESDAEATALSDLDAEHRGAKTEPFLDRIASFFGGGSNDKGSILRISISADKLFGSIFILKILDKIQPESNMYIFL
jgi:hypothetical protein